MTGIVGMTTGRIATLACATGAAPLAATGADCARASGADRLKPKTKPALPQRRKISGNNPLILIGRSLP